MITEDYVSFETAKLLKGKGFDAKCRYVYMYTGMRVASQIFMEGESSVNNDDIESVAKYDNWITYTQGDYAFLCPTIQMAMKWLREVHKLGVFPTTFYRHTKTFDGHNYGCTLVNLKTFDVIGNFEDCTFPADSYEEACEAAIKYCLENLVQKDNNPSI